MNSFQTLGAWLLVLNTFAVIAGYVLIFATTVSRVHRCGDAWGAGILCTVVWTLVSAFMTSLFFSQVVSYLFTR